MPLALVVSHGHPAFSIGGAQVASYNLYRGLGDGTSGWDSHYLAGVGPPLAPPSHDAADGRQGRRQRDAVLGEDYDWLNLANPELALARRSIRALPARAGARRRALPPRPGLRRPGDPGGAPRARASVPIVLTLHEYLSICHHHGQMVTPGGCSVRAGLALALRAVCFPEVGAGRPAAARAVPEDPSIAQVDAFVIAVALPGSAASSTGACRAERVH